MSSQSDRSTQSVADAAILDVLVCDGSIAEAAEASGLSETEVRRRLTDPAVVAELESRLDPDGDSPFDELPDDEPEDGEGNGGRGATSAKQQAANRRNAKKSTGPKSEEGRRRSSLNAVTHAGYVRGLFHIEGGLLAEDAEEFEDDALALIDSLRPRDDVEYRLAIRVAEAFVRNERLDRFEAMALAGQSNLGRDRLNMVGDPKAARVYLEMAGALEFILEEGLEDNDDVAIIPSDDYERRHLGPIVNWQELALFIRYQGPDPKVGVKNLWNKDRQPTTFTEWRSAFKALLAHHWPEEGQAHAWAQAACWEWRNKLIAVEHKDTGYAAREALAGTLEKTAKLRQRSIDELRQVLGAYEQVVTSRNAMDLDD